MEAMLKLDANEGFPEPPPAEYAAFRDREAARRYPDSRPLERALADRLGLEASRVVVGAGADDIIERYARVMLRPGGVALGTEPAFDSYAAATERAGGRYVGLPRLPEAPFPAQALAAEARRSRPAFLVFASPDNPGGGVLGPADLLELADTGTPILFDAVYSPFATEQDVYRLAPDVAGCTVLGSFSKAYGLAGLRVGWAVSSPPMAARIRAAGPPYPVATTSLAAALCVLDGGDGNLERRVVRVKAQRDELRALLVGLGARCWRGEANFVAARVRDAGALAGALAARAVLVRTWPEKPSCAGLVRITCPGDDAEFERLATALRSVKEFI
ncbi:MAG TPA: aminotransferase class I/II-fold pyridoxal phosphate-dependent enzyme [Rectinemataceae bacterium]|nr:aminotransferase class I/II-fold pyridoxal phosphate-dependent enzyme [Rectinemataceae bacterium]